MTVILTVFEIQIGLVYPVTKGLRTNSVTETCLARVAKAKKFGRDFFGGRYCYVSRIGGEGLPPSHHQAC